MIPASEVGGDYYDFRVEPDGSLVVAFGDAAGHGVAAGIERLAEELRTSGGGSPREIVDRLVERMTTWRDEQEQGDDVTLVAIRVTS